MTDAAQIAKALTPAQPYTVSFLLSFMSDEMKAALTLAVKIEESAPNKRARMVPSDGPPDQQTTFEDLWERGLLRDFPKRNPRGYRLTDLGRAVAAELAKQRWTDRPTGRGE